MATIWDLPPEGVSSRFRAPARAAEIILVDRSPGLPAEGLALASARPAAAAPNQNGGGTLVQRRIRIDPPLPR